MRFAMQTIPQQEPMANGEKTYTPPAPKPVYEFFKRVFDILLCSMALIILSPVFLVVAIAVKCEDGGKVFFSQTRLTKNGRQFQMYKFRSMCPNADAMLEALLDENEMEGPAFKIKRDPRVTKVGRFIRKTSIDELPQLINVIKGDMSIVGPRPPILREVEQYTSYQMHRLDVKTGLSCYRECHGRSNIHSFDEWVESDLKYINERSLLVDLKVIILTIWVVLSGKGAM
jgi:lipopolysaccharide/colanic/teichoic acid biosynthesis glycosyltransferase